MARATNHRKQAAARARDAKTQCPTTAADPLELVNAPASPEPLADEALYSESDGLEECHWDGTVNCINGNSDSDWKDTQDSETDSAGEFSDLEGDELTKSLQQSLAHELKMLTMPTPYEQITKKITSKEWANAESNRHLGYNGQSSRTKRRQEQKAREKEKEDSVTRNTCVY
jgi:hypothetical protein